LGRDEHADSIPHQAHIPIDSTKAGGITDFTARGDTQTPAQKKQAKPQSPSREEQIKQKLEWQKKHPELILGPPEVDTVLKPLPKR
jgi:hypothetical protein